MFDMPVPVKALVMAPGERADVLVDFSALAGQTLAVKEHQPAEAGRDAGTGTGTGDADPGSPRARPSLRRSRQIVLVGGRLPRLLCALSTTVGEYQPAGETAGWGGSGVLVPQS
jgi:hypothetical protein